MEQKDVYFKKEDGSVIIINSQSFDKFYDLAISLYEQDQNNILGYIECLKSYVKESDDADLKNELFNILSCNSAKQFLISFIHHKQYLKENDPVSSELCNFFKDYIISILDASKEIQENINLPKQLKKEF